MQNSTPRTNEDAPSVLRRELNLPALIALTFFCVAGGAYGLEDAVGAGGPGLGSFRNPNSSLALELSHRAHDRGVIHRHARRRRLRGLGAARLRPLLGISRRLVKLALQFCRQRALSGDVSRLSRLLARRHGAAGAMADRRGIDRGDNLVKRARHSLGRLVLDYFYFHRPRAFRRSDRFRRAASRSRPLVRTDRRDQLGAAFEHLALEHFGLGQRRLLRRRGGQPRQKIIPKP